jgi:hypothetical protein
MGFVPVMLMCIVGDAAAADLYMTGNEKGTSVEVSIDPDKRPLAVIGIFAVALHAILNAYEMSGELPPLWAEEPAILRRMIAATDKELGEIVASENGEEHWDGD